MSGPPVNMVMPPTAQSIFIVANCIVCVIAFAYAERYRRRSGSPVGHLLLLAGAAAVINEPVVDVLGLCWFAKLGSIGLFTAWGVTIPAFMLPVYCWYVGGQSLLAFVAMKNGLTRAGVYRLYAGFAVVNVALEVPGLNMDIYAYYGSQPAQLFGFPLWWPICNALMPISMAALVVVLLPALSGMRRLWIILLGPMAAGITNGAVAIPMWVALNSSAPRWMIDLAALISLAMGLTLASLITRIIAVDSKVPGAIHTTPRLHAAKETA